MARGAGRDREAERIDRLFESIGALRATAEALEKSKSDRAENVALDARVFALAEAKADKADLLALRDAILSKVHEDLADLSERLGGRLQGLNSRFLDLEAALKSMAENDSRRGIELARVSDTLADLRAFLEKEAQERQAFERNRWRRWRRRLHMAAQYGFQAFAGLAFVVILVREGFPGIPQALTYLRAFLGLSF